MGPLMCLNTSNGQHSVCAAVPAVRHGLLYDSYGSLRLGISDMGSFHQGTIMKKHLLQRPH